MKVSELLAILDGERRGSGTADGGNALFRESSPDRSECRIVFAEIAPSRSADVIREELERTRVGGYTLEWKVYGHDPLPGLAETLAASGFEAGDVETVLCLELGNVEWSRFAGPVYETRAVQGEAGLADVATISQQIGRRNVEAETRQLRAMLRDRPDALSIYVAYVANEPVSVGRIHFGHNPAVAELAGGRTVTTHRRKGLFTAVVASRLREAAARGCRYIFVDALPTSEPILTKLGFAALTSTQPFRFLG
ncbi:MAG: hypothetical protein NVS3B16_27030 [Vulcanimicrobiaceae bacterium]